ncbi:MAG: hypoxanthine-guanine phosphoribosyltransferase [Gammaproteobacteria bacterium]|nr:hypoxanthine-guanine phosphoribosyltransferase [Gammaproteobacteria bacterium]
MNDLREEATRVMREADCLHDSKAVEAALDRMADDIRRDLGQLDPIVICVMNGGLVAAGMLLPRLDFPLKVDYMHASRYREQTSGDALHWRVEPTQALAGRHLLIVDDILDEGYTLDAILRFCARQAPASVYACVLVRKLHDRGVRPPVNYIGLEVPDRYVFGYGMDYKGYWRNAAGIYAVKGL